MPARKSADKESSSRTEKKPREPKTEELVELPATLVQDVKNFVGLVRQQVSVGSGLWMQADELASRLP